jgi:hypothetical protein
LELLGNQYGIGSADGSRDDSAANAFQIHREHRSVKTRPRPERLGHPVSNQPVRNISIELQDAQGGNYSSRYLAVSPHIVGQALRGKSGRLIQRMAEDRRN